MEIEPFVPKNITGKSVQEDNLENQIVLLDGLSPKKKLSWLKKIVLLDRLFFRGQKKALNSLKMKKKYIQSVFNVDLCIVEPYSCVFICYLLSPSF